MMSRLLCRCGERSTACADAIVAACRSCRTGRQSNSNARRVTRRWYRHSLKHWGVAMFPLDAELKVLVHREAIDFRKSINGLSVLVEQSMKLDPFARAVYAFTNRRRDRVKLLLYERTVFWILMN